MTDALRKMVEAMAAEIKRQAEQEAADAGQLPKAAFTSSPPQHPDYLFVHAHLHLEKVARAGLEAIKPEMEDLLTGANREIFALILKETP